MDCESADNLCQLEAADGTMAILSTEAGLVNNFNRSEYSRLRSARELWLTPPIANPGKNWAWWEPNPDAELVFSPAGDGTYEVIVLVSSST